MPQQTKAKGPWFHRFLIGLFTILLALLSFWLIGFVLDDINTIPGPDYEEVEKEFLSQSLLDERKAVDKQLVEIGRKIQQQRNRQSLLRDSTSRSETTINRLVELQRLSVQKEVKPEEAQQKALAESVDLFLANQKRDQALSEDIANFSEEERTLQERRRNIEEKLEKEREPARKEFERLVTQHLHLLAAYKLAFLLPLLAVVVVAFLKKRNTLYAPVIYATGAAVLGQTILVIHEHFPTRYFKYIVLAAALGLVGFILVSLLRTLRFPKSSWLLKQYREAYEAFMCPICEYPIRRGPLKYLYWTRRSIKKLAVPQSAAAEDEAYSCPACGSRLYEECAECKTMRHSLLPFCENCGNEKPVEARTA